MQGAPDKKTPDQSAPDRLAGELLALIFETMQLPEKYIAHVNSLEVREQLRLDLRDVIGHLSSKTSPVWSDEDLSNDNQLKRVLRSAVSATWEDADVRPDVEALIARTMEGLAKDPEQKPPPEKKPKQSPDLAPEQTSRSNTTPIEKGRPVTLKASGGPLYPALETEPESPVDEKQERGAYLSSLMPPPLKVDVPSVEGWLRGQAWHPDVINITLDNPDMDLIDDILEIETEIDRHAEEILARSGLRAPQDPESAEEKRNWLLSLGGAENDAVAVFERCVFMLMRRHQPAEYNMLHKMTPALAVGENVPDMLCATKQKTSEWLEQEGYQEPEHPHNPMGTINGFDRLTENTALERAAFLHLFTSQPLADALFDSLLELRLAQLERHLDDSSPSLRMEHVKTILAEGPDAPLGDYIESGPEAEMEM